MAFYHGIKTNEIPTKILPSLDLESGLIFAVGTSAIHLATAPAEANKPVLCYELSEYVEQFGYTGNFEDFTLDEVANSAFQLYGISPVIFVNVLDPAKHYKPMTLTVEGIISTPAKLKNAVLLNTLEIKSEGDVQEVELIKDQDYTAETQITEEGTITTIDIKVEAQIPSEDLKISYTVDGVATTVEVNLEGLPLELPAGANDISVKAVVGQVNYLVLDEDYTAAYNSDNEVVITILDAEKIFNDKVEISFNEVDPSQVTAADIIGGYDAVTGKYKGLETIEQVYPQFRLTPGIILAPKFSQDVTVAAIMKAKCYDINTVFNAIACVDIPTDVVTNYTGAAEYKAKKNLIDPALIVCYPKISLGEVQYNLSTQLACLMNQVDAQEGEGIPYISPSNHRLQMDKSVLADGTELFLTLDQANYLNSQGIGTALNFANGWTAWGNRTGDFPSSTDVKDVFIAVKRMTLWLRNTITLSYWSRVDQPINQRFIESFLDSINIYFNGLKARGVILDGKIQFLSKENPTTDLLSGKVRFHILWTPPVPAEQIIFDIEYDPSGLQNLFE